MTRCAKCQERKNHQRSVWWTCPGFNELTKPFGMPVGEQQLILQNSPPVRVTIRPRKMQQVQLWQAGMESGAKQGHIDAFNDTRFAIKDSARRNPSILQ